MPSRVITGGLGPAPGKAIKERQWYPSPRRDGSAVPARSDRSVPGRFRPLGRERARAGHRDRRRGAVGVVRSRSAVPPRLQGDHGLERARCVTGASSGNAGGDGGVPGRLAPLSAGPGAKDEREPSARAGCRLQAWARYSPSGPHRGSGEALLLYKLAPEAPAAPATSAHARTASGRRTPTPFQGKERPRGKLAVRGAAVRLAAAKPEHLHASSQIRYSQEADDADGTDGQQRPRDQVIQRRDVLDERAGHQGQKHQARLDRSVLITRAR
jgi:hypothetical protein